MFGAFGFAAAGASASTLYAVPGNSATIPAAGTAYLQVQAIALQPGVALPAGPFSPAVQPLASDRVRTALYYGIDWGYTESAPYQVALAVWWAQDGNWQSEDRVIAERLAGAAAGASGTPSWNPDGRNLLTALAQSQVSLGELSLVPSELNPSLGRGTLAVTNLSQQDLTAYLPYGTVFSGPQGAVLVWVTGSATPQVTPTSAQPTATEVAPTNTPEQAPATPTTVEPKGGGAPPPPAPPVPPQHKGETPTVAPTDTPEPPAPIDTATPEPTATPQPTDTLVLADTPAPPTETPVDLKTLPTETEVEKPAEAPGAQPQAAQPQAAEPASSKGAQDTGQAAEKAAAAQAPSDNELAPLPITPEATQAAKEKAQSPGTSEDNPAGQVQPPAPVGTSVSGQGQVPPPVQTGIPGQGIPPQPVTTGAVPQGTVPPAVVTGGVPPSPTQAIPPTTQPTKPPEPTDPGAGDATPSGGAPGGVPSDVKPTPEPPTPAPTPAPQPGADQGSDGGPVIVVTPGDPAGGGSQVPPASPGGSPPTSIASTGGGASPLPLWLSVASAVMLLGGWTLRKVAHGARREARVKVLAEDKTDTAEE